MGTFFQLLSPLPLNREEDAIRIFQLWDRFAPSAFPDRIGSFEPLREEFSIDRIKTAIGMWEYQVLLKRVSKPKMQSSIFMQYGPHRKHSLWSIFLSEKVPKSANSLKALIEGTSESFRIDFALLHRISEVDMNIGLASGSIGYLDSRKRFPNLFLTTQLLQKYIPDLYWITLLGPPYVKLFSKERILSAPLHQITEMPDGSMILQLTENIEDAAKRPELYMHVKNAVKQHLGADAFFEISKGTQCGYHRPCFAWVEPHH